MPSPLTWGFVFDVSLLKLVLLSLSCAVLPIFFLSTFGFIAAVFYWVLKTPLKMAEHIPGGRAVRGITLGGV